MPGHTLVAVYETHADAERAREKLISIGVQNAAIRLSEDNPPEDHALAGKEERGGFWAWLLGTDLPQSDRDWYRSSVREGRTALSVHVEDGLESARLVDVLDEYGPVEIDDTGTALTDAATPPSPAVGLDSEREQHIPVVKEELEVGKRQTERRYRVRVYPVDRPVEEQVMLRDEKVVVERRPVGDRPAAGTEGLQTRDVEIIERHEEPVVGKRVRQTEDVVIRKEVKDRTETVRGTVRETKVDVDAPEGEVMNRGPRK